MRLFSTRQLLLCFVLTALSGYASASETRHTSLDNAPASETAAPAGDRFEDTDIDGAVAAMHAQRPVSKVKAAPVAPTQTSGDSRTLPARFHSFLPGMFR